MLAQVIADGAGSLNQPSGSVEHVRHLRSSLDGLQGNHPVETTARAKGNGDAVE
jgi:hypothetical protein